MVEKFFDFGGIDFYLMIILAVFNAYLLMKFLNRGMIALQLDEYKNKRFFCFLFKSFNQYFGGAIYIFALSVLFAICVTLVFNLFSIGIVFSFISVVCYLYLMLDFIEKEEKLSQSGLRKSKLNFTKRLKRLYFLAFLINFIATFALLRFSCMYVSFLGYGAISFSILLAFIILPFANLILKPFEWVVYMHYIKLAKKKLNDYPNLIKIAITGSYGKTSTKFILHKLLSENFKVCTSPNSFNTPMGLTKVILNNLQPYNDVLLVEMGANEKNDIKKLCDFINPQIGIVTAIGNAHLKTFKTKENLIKTKFQLVESVEQFGKGGFMVFNADNAGSSEFYGKCSCDKCEVSCKQFGVDVFALNVAYSEKGASFTLCTQSGKIDCKTKLVGKHNIENILLASSVALKLGVELRTVAKLINQLEPIKHRLELRADGEHFVLDDAFNSNQVGFVNALEVLSFFKGKKIVVTPGIVELDKDAYNSNYYVATKIASVADVCIIVNKENEKALSDGLGEKIKVYKAQTFNEAMHILNDEIEVDACVLFENDLPDNYV